MSRSTRARLDKLERQLEEEPVLLDPDWKVLTEGHWPAFVSSLRGTTLEEETRRYEKVTQLSVEEILKHDRDKLRQLEEELKQQTQSGFVEVPLPNPEGESS